MTFQAASPLDEHELESPTLHRKLKTKLQKGKPEETSFSAQKSPRTYGKKTPGLVQQTSTESLSDDVSSNKRAPLKKLSSVSSTSSMEAIPSTPSTPTPTSAPTPVVPTSALSPVSAPTTPVISSPNATGFPGSASSKKYPRRENRKPPAHLADAFSADLLFSTPDIIKRVVKTPSGQLLSPGEAPNVNEVGMTAESLSMAGTVSEEVQQPQQPSEKMDILGN